MHQLNYPSEIIDRIRKRRGSLHVHEVIEATRTALLVVDMQKAYLNGPAQIPALEDIVPNINRLAAALRARGGTVIWIKNTLAGDSVPNWPPYARLRSPEFNEKTRRALTDGAAGHDLLDGLAVDQQDSIEKKYRYSAFTDASPEIESRLRARGADLLIITGTVTNVCCESTARDAMMKNFDIVMISDANAARTDQEHVGALLNVWQFFGDVMTTDELIERLV